MGQVGHQFSEALTRAIESTTLESTQVPGAYDVVVVGAGAAGGLAAHLLTEQGARVLVLDAGVRPTRHDAPLTTFTAETISKIADPRLLGYVPLLGVALGRKMLRAFGKVRQPIQSKCFAWERDPLAFVDDRKNPYLVDEGTNFHWFRSRQIGGRMLVPGHGCQYYRLYPEDFDRTEFGEPIWPFKAEALDPWYDAVERRLGLRGLAEPAALLPDSRIAFPLEPIANEAETRRRLAERWPGLSTTLGRWAPPLDSMNLAAQTGRLACRQGAVVREVEVDAEGRVAGVKWVDVESGRIERVSAGKVFLCASTLESTRILMLSRDARGSLGLGGASGRLGRYLMDHVVVSADGVGPSIAKQDAAVDPRRCVFVPRFDLQTGAPSGSGFSIQIYMHPASSRGSMFTAISFSEMAPRVHSRVSVDPYHVDAWGIPTLRISATHSDAERALASEQSRAIVDLAKALGVRIHRLVTTPPPVGSAIHECGTARLGASPETSVLDPNSECWDARGLYVTDGAALPSQGINNPTLTIMALTARACAHAMGDGGSAGERPKARKGETVLVT